MNRDTLWLANVIQRALEQDREVTLTKAERYGLNVEIDGEPVTESPNGEGLPWESFDYPLLPHRGLPPVTEDAVDHALDIMFSGPEPRCPVCTGPREWYTVSAGDAREVSVSRCIRCQRTAPARGDQRGT